MLVLDFINVGNGDSILIQELEGGARRFAMLVDCGHDNLIRDDHPVLQDPRSRRIYAGDFLKKQGIGRLDILLATHFHRDHIGGLGRILEAAEVDRFLATYVPPEKTPPLDPDGDNGRRGAEPPPVPGHLCHGPPGTPRAGGGVCGDSRGQGGDPPFDGGADHGYLRRRARPVPPAKGGV